MIILKPNDTESLLSSLNDIDYIFNDYNDDENNVKNDNNPFNDFLSFYVSTRQTTQQASDNDYYLLKNLPSSVIQLTILILVIFFVFVVCKCNKFLSIFRNYKNNEYKNSLTKETILYKDELTVRDYLCCFNSFRPHHHQHLNHRGRAGFRRRAGAKRCFIFSLFKRKRNRATFAKRNNRFNKYFDRQKTLKAGVTTPQHRRGESLLKRNSIVQYSMHHQNRVYSSLRQTNNNKLSPVGIGTQSIRIKNAITPPAVL